MSEKEISFLPFHAINEFMRGDYRLTVLRTALNAAPELPESVRKPLEQAVKKHVKVPGFRNAEKAPAPIKAMAMGKAFEQHPDVVASVIAAWAASKPDLQQQVYAVLEKAGWKFFPTELSLTDLSPDKVKEWAILPLSADRTRLPGFATQWPHNSNFESLYDAFTAMYPDVNESIDNVSLMVVWITMRLPVDVEEETDAEETGDNSQPEQA
jgi:hypothetical protein